MNLSSVRSPDTPSTKRSLPDIGANSAAGSWKYIVAMMAS
jgi:hypothetical protein